MNGVTFCFIVTQDLNKETIWKRWLEGLDALRFPYKVVTHCSNPEQITSPYLKKTLMNRHYPTKWGRILRAEWELFKYAYEHTESEWFILLSESCIPIRSPQSFVDLYSKYRSKSIVNYSPAWWDVQKHNRAELRSLPREYHIGHDTWLVLCRNDITDIKQLEFNNDMLFDTCFLDGSISDESMIAVWLKKANNFANTIRHKITLVDWTRTNGNNPYTFNRMEPDFIEKEMNANPFSMFLRKVGKECPDTDIVPYLTQFQLNA
jgi:hypothetical protein